MGVENYLPGKSTPCALCSVGVSRMWYSREVRTLSRRDAQHGPVLNRVPDGRCDTRLEEKKQAVPAEHVEPTATPKQAGLGACEAGQEHSPVMFP